MFHSTVNNHSYQIENIDKDFFINEELFAYDLAVLGENHFHILLNHTSYRAEIIKVDATQKIVVVNVNGKNCTVSLKSKFDLLLDKMGMTSSTSGQLNFILAPMPGLIIDLKVKPGDEVKKGDVLLILEAMKMENVIKSPGSGIVKEVKVQKGNNVEKGYLLITF